MANTRFLFWNLNQRPIPHLVAELAHERTIDVIILAESELGTAELLRALNPASTGAYDFPLSMSARLQIFSRFLGNYMQPVFEDDRMTIRRLLLPSRNEILLAAVHLPSKMYFSNPSQMLGAARVLDKIIRAEDDSGHQRTVVVGDFNMNPYEEGMVAAGAFHATMSRSIAARMERTVQGQRYRFFYNPLWNHLGDARGPTD